MTVSIVVPVVVALQDIVTAALPAGFAVSVGQPPGGDVPAQYAAVAYGGDDRAGIVGAGNPGRYGNEESAEAFNVWCTISTASGDQLGAAQLGITNGLYIPVAAAIRANRQLNGAVPPPGLASLGTYEWTVDDGGQIATVFFQVEVVAPWLAN